MAILSAPDYYSSVSIAGKYGTEMKPVLVDTDGQMYIVMTGQEIDVANLPGDYFKADQNVGSIAGSEANLTVEQLSAERTIAGAIEGITNNVTVDQSDSDRVIQGAVEGNFPVVALDATGIMLSRMKGAASGEIVLKILDDCGDTSTITDWVESQDGLNPVDNQVYVKQGIHSMALGVDADKGGTDVAAWIRNVSLGDLSVYQHDWVYLWFYISEGDYALTAFNSMYFDIGNDATHRIYFLSLKANLLPGWNLLKFDLDNPSGSQGVIDWVTADYMRIAIICEADNTNDFTVYVDCFMLVRPTPGAGTLKDIAIDENGILLSKMTGQYADILKPIAIDQNGLMLAVMKGAFNDALKTIAVDTNGIMKANLSAQDLSPLRVMPTYGSSGRQTDDTNCADSTDETLVTIIGKGIIYGGFWRWVHDVSIREGLCSLYIDDALIATATAEELHDRGLDVPGSYPIFNTLYDDNAHSYTVGVGWGITFEEKVELHFYHEHGDVVVVTWEIIWAKPA